MPKLPPPNPLSVELVLLAPLRLANVSDCGDSSWNMQDRRSIVASSPIRADPLAVLGGGPYILLFSTGGSYFNQRDLAPASELKTR